MGSPYSLEISLKNLRWKLAAFSDQAMICLQAGLRKASSPFSISRSGSNFCQWDSFAWFSTALKRGKIVSK